MVSHRRPGSRIEKRVGPVLCASAAIKTQKSEQSCQHRTTIMRCCPLCWSGQVVQNPYDTLAKQSRRPPPQRGSTLCASDAVQQAFHSASRSLSSSRDLRGLAQQDSALHREPVLFGPARRRPPRRRRRQPVGCRRWRMRESVRPDRTDSILENGRAFLSGADAATPAPPAAPSRHGNADGTPTETRLSFSRQAAGKARISAARGPEPHAAPHRPRRAGDYFFCCFAIAYGLTLQVTRARLWQSLSPARAAWRMTAPLPLTLPIG
jgi:hypothetical protein